MNNKILILILILMILAVGGGWYYKSQKEIPPTNSELATEQAANLNITSFSLGGTVVVASANQFTFRTGQVQQTSEGNKFVEEVKTVKIVPSTTILRGTAKASVSDITAGSAVTVSTNSNPFKISEIQAAKIVIQ